MIGRFLNGMELYLQQRTALAEYARECAREHGFGDCEVAINAADDAESGSIYLTVTGTSAEAGDDGQVGRGNRVNGLITPWRPMSLEAAAGKNPISHVGKIYNILAKRVAETLVTAMPGLAAAQCLIVSRIGAPVSMPDLVHLKLATKDGVSMEQLRERSAEIVSDHLGRIPELVGEFVTGEIHVY